ncbi:MAG: FAD-dependent oxidoreductase [Bifidobacterium sp.]|jgi:NADH peroxidase|nr:FAD-dependent oxidoreductase [Bifidobacterium sp.]
MGRAKKIIVVGSSHGGYEAVQQVLQDAPDAEIQWYEKGQFLSFLSYGMQRYLEGTVKEIDSARYAAEASGRDKNLRVFLQQEITAVDAAAHTVHVIDHAAPDGAARGGREESYDKLIISPGADPIRLPVEGGGLANIHVMRGRDWAIKLKEATIDPDIGNVVIIGAGYIGIEAAEVFVKAGKHVTIIDLQPRMLAMYLDAEFTDILTGTLAQHGVVLATGQRVLRYEGVDGKVARVVTDRCAYPADLVIEAAGVRANTDWLDGVVERDKRGLIAVDDHQATSATDIYAVGDATTVRFAPTGGRVHLALATNARRQGRIAAKNALGEDVSFTPVSGSSGLPVFDYKFASTGIKECTASEYGVSAKFVFVEDLYRPSFVQADAGNAPVYFKLAYAPENGRVLGAQIMSIQNTTANINAIALAIQLHATVQDLAYADFFFQPGLNSPWNIINVAAQQAAREIGE